MSDFDQLDQVVFRVNMLEALRASIAGDCVIDLATLPNFSAIGNLNEVQSVPAFGECVSTQEAPNLIQWSTTFENYLDGGGQVYPNLVWAFGNLEQVADEGRFNQVPIYSLAVPPSFGFLPQFGNPGLFRPTLQWTISPDGFVTTAQTSAEPTHDFFQFACDVVASALDVLSNYISEADRKARESWKRLRRRNILSSSVSKNGHLSFLLPRYRQVCVETAARDQIVHLEVIVLAEEQEAPGGSAVGQILISGGKSWKRWKNRLSNLFSRFLRKMLPTGFMAVG